MKRRYTPKMSSEAADLQLMQQAQLNSAEDAAHQAEMVDDGPDNEMVSHLRERLALEDTSKTGCFNGDYTL